MVQTSDRLEDGTPFPTMFWLTCKTLCSRIGTLESCGWMARLNRRLSADRQLREALAVSTEAYLSRRARMGGPGYGEAQPPYLSFSGHPGGGPERIKCLHAHTAHHLVTGDNPVGAAVLGELAWQDPLTPCV